MAENPNATFVSEICTMVGSRFPRWLDLLVVINTTSRVFKVCMCMFSPRKSGRAKTQPTQLLATAMLRAMFQMKNNIHEVSSVYFFEAILIESTVAFNKIRMYKHHEMIYVTHIPLPTSLIRSATPTNLH